MSQPASLSADLIERHRRRPYEPPLVLPVRSHLAGDLRFFLIAWLFGFVVFFVLIA